MMRVENLQKAIDLARDIERLEKQVTAYRAAGVTAGEAGDTGRP
jgi:hypothetical protein